MRRGVRCGGGGGSGGGGCGEADKEEEREKDEEMRGRAAGLRNKPQGLGGITSLFWEPIESLMNRGKGIANR